MSVRIRALALSTVAAMTAGALSVPTAAVPVPPEMKLAHPDKLATHNTVIAIRLNTQQDSSTFQTILIQHFSFDFVQRLIKS